MLSEQQKDILGEVVNVFIGQAASLLSEMTGQEIRLNIPQVVLLTGDSIVLDPKVADDIWAQGHVVSSSINFSQGLHGKTFLMFPASQAKALVNACLGEMELLPAISESRDLLDTDFDVLKEVANVILNSIMGGFSGLLDTCLEYSVPEIEMLFAPDNEQRQFLSRQQNVLLLKTELFLDAASVQGFILIAFSMNSISLLLEKINSMTEDFSDYAG
jgi:chemotaxis protein CheC